MNELKIGFSTYTNHALVARGREVHEALTTGQGPEYFPDPDPSPTVIKASFEALDSALAMETCSSVAALREHYRIILIDQLVRLAASIELTANGDMVKLKDCGYELRKTTRHRYTGLPDAPQNVVVMPNGFSGQALMKCKPVTHAKSYIAEYQLYPGGAWIAIGGTTRTKNFVFIGLDPGQIYRFRVCAISSNGTGPWSEPVSMMVV